VADLVVVALHQKHEQNASETTGLTWRYLAP